MKIFHCNTTTSGGAANAVKRLNAALCAENVYSNIGSSVGEQYLSNQFRVPGKWKGRYCKFALRMEVNLMNFLQTDERSIYSICAFTNRIYKEINRYECDIVHLHWVQHNFIPFCNFPYINRPLVLTMHDTWPFTGGCHYPKGCEQYTSGCTACPHVRKNAQWFISYVTRMKKRSYRASNINFIAPSRAFFEMGRKSSLLEGCRLHHIPNAIDTTSYAPMDQVLARKLLNIAPEGFTLLFGAESATSDSRKGYDLLVQALRRLPMYFTKPVRLLVFGGTDGVGAIGSYPIHYLGRLHDDLTLRTAYAAADVFVCPSREDNLPNTVMESLACGTPVASFAVGGIPDMVDDKINGCLATPEEPDSLAYAISYILGNSERRSRMQYTARKIALERYAMKIIAKKHIELYSNIINK